MHTGRIATGYPVGGDNASVLRIARFLREDGPDEKKDAERKGQHEVRKRDEAAICVTVKVVGEGQRSINEIERKLEKVN